MGINRFGGTLGIGKDRVRWGAFHEQLIAIRPIPIRAPLPDISGHVKKAVVIFGITFDGGRTLVAIHQAIGIGEDPEPDIRLRRSFIGRFVPPSIVFPRQAPPRGKFPFRLGGQSLLRPMGVGHRIFIGDVNHRMVRLGLPGVARPSRELPRIARLKLPPLKTVVTVIHFCGWGRKHTRSGNQHGRGHIRKLAGIHGALRNGLVSG